MILHRPVMLDISSPPVKQQPKSRETQGFEAWNPTICRTKANLLDNRLRGFGGRTVDVGYLGPA